MRIRPASVADADGIADAHTRAWQAAYRGLLPDAFLDGLDVAERAARWRAILADDRGVLVAVDDDGIAGFAATGASRDDDGAACGELYAIYVRPDRWSAGIGRALLGAALDALRAGGYAEATLWVLDGNERAERFYARTGWHDDGVVKDDEIAGHPVRERRWRIAL